MGGLKDLSPAAAAAIGVIVGLISTSIQSVGLTLQRKSHLLEDEKRDEYLRRPPYRRRRWQLGMLMFIVANIVGSVVQITTLPLPVLSTLQASGLVFNTLCAAFILGEPLTRWSVGGTILVVGGAILIALYGSVPEPSHNLNQLLWLLTRRQFLLWIMGTALIVAAIIAATLVMKRFKTKHTPRMRLLRGMSYGALSGILSAHALLVAKSAVELLVRTIIDHRNQFNRWQSWLILVALVVLALSQLFFLHRGLKLCSTSALYPFVFCIYNIFAILNGLIYFKQTASLSALDAGLIALGTVILLLGVLSLSWRLENVTTAPPPPDVHTLLTPGMGLVEDTTTEDEESPVDSEDERIADSTERSPLLGNGVKRTTTMKQNAILKVTRQRRQHFPDPDPEEIWDELQEPDPPSPRSSRRVSFGNIDTRRRSRTFSNRREPAEQSDGDSPPASTRIRRVHTAGVWRDRERENRQRMWPKRRSRTRATSTPTPHLPKLRIPSPEERRSDRRTFSARIADWWNRPRSRESDGQTPARAQDAERADSAEPSSSRRLLDDEDDVGR